MWLQNSRQGIRRLTASSVIAGIGLILIVLAPGFASAAPLSTTDKPARGGHFKVDRPDPALTASWWQTYVALPGSPNPFERCDLGTGKIVFLAGTTGGTAERSCTIPKDKTFLVPLINVECSQAEGDDKRGPLTTCAKNIADTFTNLSLVIDGQSAPNLNGLRVATGEFTFTSVQGNIFGIPPFVNSKSVSDGYWALIKLTPAEHTIIFGGEGTAPDGTHFTAGPITYHLTVRK